MTTRKSQSASLSLSKQRYAALVRDVSELVARASTAVDQQRVQAQWHLGARITRERLDHSSGYHNSILRDLSADVRLSLRNLQYAVAFYGAYPKLPKLALSWQHYRVLLACPEREDREHYAALALRDHLSARKLASIIATDLLGAPSSQAQALARPNQPNYLYAAQVLQILDGDTLDLSIDLGFHTHHQARVRLAQIDAPELPSNEARAARDFVYQKLIPASTLVVQTHRSDIYGRYLAHVFYSDEELTVAECFTQGTHLNAELVQEGHAERVG